MKLPSTSGPKLPGLPSRSATGLPRRQASASPVVQPSALASAVPEASATSLVVGGVVQPPLSLITRWNRPRLLGEATCKQTSCEPADSPKIVTLVGSPP